MAHFDTPRVGVTPEDLAKHKAKLQRQAKRRTTDLADEERRNYIFRRRLVIEQEKAAKAARAAGQEPPEIDAYERFQKPKPAWRPSCPVCISEGVEPAEHHALGLCRRHYARHWAKHHRPSRAKPKTSPR